MKAGWTQNNERKVSFDTFDGRGALRQSLDCSAEEALPLSKHMAYSGPADMCQFSMQTLSGFAIETEKEKKKRLKREAKERKKTEKRRAKGEPDELPRVWFAPLGDSGLVLPVQARMKSGWGTVKMFLKSYRTERLELVSDEGGVQTTE